MPNNSISQPELAAQTDRTKARRQQIIEKTAWLWLHEGYCFTSLHDIAHHCAISKGGLGHYFSKKSQLLKAVLSWIGQQERKGLFQHFFTKDNSSKETVHNFLQAFHHYCQLHPEVGLPGFISIEYVTRGQAIDRLIRTHFTLWQDTLFQFFNRHFREDVAMTKAHLTVSAIQGSFLLDRITRQYTYVDEAFQILMKEWE